MPSNEKRNRELQALFCQFKLVHMVQGKEKKEMLDIFPIMSHRKKTQFSYQEMQWK
jgi:hypothetical protein